MTKYTECLKCPYQYEGCPDFWFGETHWENAKVITRTGCAYTSPDYGTPIGQELYVANLMNNIDLPKNATKPR